RSTRLFDLGSSRFMAPRFLSGTWRFFSALLLPRFRLRTSPGLLGPGLHRQPSADSSAFAAFRADFLATIHPLTPHTPSPYLDRHGLGSGLPSFGRSDEVSLGHVNRLSPESSPPNFQSLWWYWTSPSLAGLSGSASQHGLAACSGFCLHILRTPPRGLGTMCQLALPPPRGVQGTCTP